jgi:hypothetical protein
VRCCRKSGPEFSYKHFPHSTFISGAKVPPNCYRWRRAFAGRPAIRSGKIAITPALFYQDDLKRRLMVTLNMTKVVQHIWQAIDFENAEDLEPVFDRDRPIRSTGNMSTWYTGRPCERTDHSHINFCVYDSTWEATEEQTRLSTRLWTISLTR